MKNKNSIKLSVSFLLLFFAVSISAQSVKLKIVETSDVHGAIFPYDFVNEREADASLSQVQTYLNIERSKKDQHVLLFDAGDMLQGTPVVYYYNFEKTDVPHVYASVMNFMKYDLATIGNHDIETGHPVYDRFKDELKFPWLAANAINTDNGETYFQPYQMFEIEGVKIAVLGLITPAIPKWLPPKIWSGIEFLDMVETAQKWVTIINEKENPDILIGLFHSGVEFTYGGEEETTNKNENAAALVAVKVPGFDIVFVGHDHHGWNKIVTNSEGKEVWIIGPKANARDLAVANVTLNFIEESDEWEKSITGEIVEVNQFKPDPEFLSTFDESYKEVEDFVSRPIGVFTETISSRDALFGPSAFVDLIHNIQLELTGADVSFTAPLSLNSKIDSGEVNVRDMFKLYRYENQLYTYWLTGQEIKDYLEYSYSRWFNEMKNESDNLLMFTRDESGNVKFSKRMNAPELAYRYYNFDSAAGIDYVVDVSKPVGSRVKINSLSNGDKFDLSAKYKVAVNSYRGSGGGGHITEGSKIPADKLSERLLDSTDKDLRYYMMKWIEEKGTVEPFSFNIWKVAPESWWKNGRDKDYQLMYNNRRD